MDEKTRTVKEEATDTRISQMCKKTYSAPRLIEWGQLHELTLTGGYGPPYDFPATSYSGPSGF